MEVSNPSIPLQYVTNFFLSGFWFFNLFKFVFPKNSPVPSSLPEPMTASEAAARKSQIKAR